MQQLTLTGEPASKRQKKGGAFSHHHAAQYGLKLGSVDAASGRVETVACRFCIVFGRETGPTLLSATGKTRSAVSTKKMWSLGHFRTDMYTKHHLTQHAIKWAEYQALSNADKETFFTVVTVPYVETLPASFEGEKCLEFNVTAPIVDVIVGDLLFHPADVAQLTESRSRALAVFQRVNDKYCISEKHPSRFRLAVQFMSRGASFSMVAGLMDDVKEETDIGRFGGCTEHVAARYARVICAVALQRLSNLLCSAWAVSFALDAATHQGKSYVDVRCRFSTKSRLHNFHLVALPLHTRHTGENIFELVKTFLDVLLPTWRKQVLGISTDGAATMVGKVKGVATRIENEAETKLTRVWCGLHQLDLKMQIVFERALQETYLDKLHALIGYLRRQYNLISDMQSTCPKVAILGGCQCSQSLIGFAVMSSLCART